MDCCFVGHGEANVDRQPNIESWKPINEKFPPGIVSFLKLCD
jgi:hypothetical protein